VKLAAKFFNAIWEIQSGSVEYPANVRRDRRPCEDRRARGGLPAARRPPPHLVGRLDGISRRRAVAAGTDRTPRWV